MRCPKCRVPVMKVMLFPWMDLKKHNKIDIKSMFINRKEKDILFVLIFVLLRSRAAIGLFAVRVVPTYVGQLKDHGS